jgi:hypothetical protein
VNRPQVGLQIVLNGTPIELLYRKAGPEMAQVWRAKRLFVDDQAEIDVTITPMETCKALHTQHP